MVLVITDLLKYFSRNGTMQLAAGNYSRNQTDGTG
jgi:hypothetical protein